MYCFILHDSTGIHNPWNNKLFVDLVVGVGFPLLAGSRVLIAERADLFECLDKRLLHSCLVGLVDGIHHKVYIL